MPKPNYETFVFGSFDSANQSVVMADEWLDVSPGIEYEAINIEGRNGAIYTALNYQDVVRNVECFLMDSSNVDAVRAGMKGSGDLIFKNRIRKAHIFDQFEFEKYGHNALRFIVPFIMEPFWHSNDSYVTYSSGSNIPNEGNRDSYPLIKVVMPASSTGTVEIDDYQFTLKNTDSAAQTIEIDCKEKSETYPACMTLSGFEYPALKPGNNKLTVTGAAFTVSVKRRSCWIG